MCQSVIIRLLHEVLQPQIFKITLKNTRKKVIARLYIGDGVLAII
jgi:hypothetical protein